MIMNIFQKNFNTKQKPDKTINNLLKYFKFIILKDYFKLEMFCNECKTIIIEYYLFND